MPVFTSLRPVAAVLLVALPCLANTCGLDDNVRPACRPQRLGRLSLPARSRAWLPVAPPDSLRFINSRGFRLSMYRVPAVEAPGDSVALLAEVGPRPSTELLREEPGELCGPFFQAERRRVRYVGRTLPLTISYALLRDLSGYYPGWSLSQHAPAAPLTAVADTLPDVVVVSFNEQPLAHFPVVRRPLRQPFGAVRYVDTVRVAGQLLRGVYQYELSTAGLSAGTVAPQRLYFQPGQGLVGFIYTNREEWARY